MKNTIFNGIAVIALVISLVALVGGNGQSAQVGGGTRFPNGISADSTSPSTGEVRSTTLTVTGDATVGGGDFVVTTSNTATSSIEVGCFQFYATSTETAHKFQASTTPGVMYSQYGSC